MYKCTALTTDVIQGGLNAGFVLVGAQDSTVTDVHGDGDAVPKVTVPKEGQGPFLHGAHSRINLQRNFKGTPGRQVIRSHKR